MAALPGVVQCAGYGVADDAGRVNAWRWPCGCATAHRSSSTRWSTAWSRAGLAKWKIPEELVVWDEPLPETASGKVQRNQLEERGDGSTPHARAASALSSYQRMTNSSVSSISSMRSAIISAERSGSVMPVVMPRKRRDTRPPPTEYA